jgi:lactate permease
MLYFGAGPELIAYTQVKAVLLTLDVLYIVWTALLLFHTADEAGAVRVIGAALPRLTADRMMQGLLLGWLFASFLQGMGGFGVPVAVAAPLLVGLGFSPVQAVIMACVGHGWAVNFGSLATSFQTLIAVTGLPGEILAPWASVLLGLSSFFCGALVAAISAGWKGFWRGLPAVALLGLVMGTAQFWLVTHHLWNLGATGAAMTGLLAGILLTRLPLYRRAQAGERVEDVIAPGRQTVDDRRPTADRGQPSAVSRPYALPIAISAYIVLVLLAFTFNLIPAIGAGLERFQFVLDFPELVTRYGFTTPAGSGRAIHIFSHTGAILLYASFISFFIYTRTGSYQPGAANRILAKTAHGAIGSSLGIVAMVGMAVVMSHSGMTNLLAQGLSQSFGQRLYPIITPFIGALGAFITGSNNNSNVLFAVLQQRTAELLGLSVPLILGSQTAGGSLGSIMAPAKVIVGCSTVGLNDQESLVMGRVIALGLIPIAVVAVVTWLLA